MGDVQDLGHIDIPEGKEDEHSEEKGGEEHGEESVSKHRW